MKKRIIVLLVVFLEVVLLVSCGRGNVDKEEDKSLNIEGRKETTISNERKKTSFLLITIDTWRSDYIGVSKSGKVETPNLDRLAGEGVYEKKVETPCPLTTPAHATILTGLLPLKHGILDCVSFSLLPKCLTLAELFKRKGYETAAFVSSETLKSRYGLNRGFDFYDDSGLEGKTLNLWDSISKDGKETTQSVLKYINGKDGEDPQFLWVHYYDLHIPYRERGSISQKYKDNPYAAQVAFIDEEIRKLINRIEIDKRKWRIIIVGDHGEGLGDHDEPEHGLALYTETLHVPLIIYPKPEKELKYKGTWRLEDLFPTIAEWFELDFTDRIDGQSLFLESKEDRLLPSFTILPVVQFGVNPVLGMRKGDLMYMRHGIEELYDLKVDPNQKINLIERTDYKNIVKTLSNECSKVFKEEVLFAKMVPNLKLSSEELKKLQSLGYMSGTTIPAKRIQKVNIREVCKDFGVFEKIRLTDSSDLLSLNNAYKMIISRYPGAMAFYENYGLFLLGQNDFAKAQNIFEQAAKIDPTNVTVIVNLGSLYLLSGKVEKAKTLLESAIVLEPDNLMVHKNLGILYSQNLNLPDKAVEHFKKYLELGGTADKNQILNYLREHSGK